MGISYARLGKCLAAPKHFFVCIKNIFPTHSARLHVYLVGILSTSNEQHSASCKEGKKKQKTLRLSTLKTHLGHEWAFYDTSILSIACGPGVVYCTVSGKGGGEWRSRDSLRSCWLFRWDELGDESESSWRNGAKCAEQSRAAVSLPTRAPMGAMAGSNFNYVVPALVI